MNVTGERLRQLRENKKLSQKEVADLIGVARPTYVLYETGKSRPIRKIKELCELFKVSSDYLLGNDTSKPIRSDVANLPDNVIQIDKRERALLDKFRQLSEVGKMKVEARLDAEYDIMKEREYTESQDA